MAKKITVLPQRPRCKNGEYEHHWILDSPNGPYSSGKCKKCKKTYDYFPNQSITTAWSMTGSA